MRIHREILKACAIALMALPGAAIAQDVIINITGPGSGAQFIEEGQSSQAPVEVTVGQTVRWVNVGTNRPHTATAFTDDGRIIFDTGELRNSGDFQDVEMNSNVFELAGGTTGSVTIEYECDFHPGSMTSSIILSAPVAPPSIAVRRDITTLNSTELTAYRDAWRTIQTNNSFDTLAGFHGCPQFFCHSDSRIFLPWHREYILRLEQALQAVDPTVALHYWDWTASSAATAGIPPAFTDRFYTSGGVTFRNPLRSFRFQCSEPSPRNTFRSPGPPFQLQFLANSVTAAYGNPTYSGFNAAIDGPHGGLHVWISGDMRSTTNAAYDPIFWAHHSNVDRQWASWQNAGGPPPIGGIENLPLPGFPGRTPADVEDFQALGFEYDRYDNVTTFVSDDGGGTSPIESDQSTPTQPQLRKSFPLRLPSQAATESAGRGGAFELVAKGIPSHPTKSFMVHVFLNSPQVTVNDIRAGNPSYIGLFGIFGGQHKPGHATESHQQKVTRSIAPIDANRIRSMRSVESDNRRNQVTIIVTDENGNAIDPSTVPIETIEIARQHASAGRIRTPRPRRADAAPNSIDSTGDANTTSGGSRFVGTSPNEDFTEAYKNAVSKAQDAFNPDARIVTEVIKITGERGTIAGLRNLSVEIKASAQ